MKKCIYIILVAGIFCLPCCEDFTGSIEGIVTDEDTGAPIVNARVIAVSMKEDIVFSTSTDERGYFIISGLRYGLNQVRVWKDGYENNRKYADVYKDGTVTVDFELTGLAIKSTIDITIKVTNESGTPVIGATVDLYMQVPAGKVFSGTETTESADGTVLFYPGFVEKNESIVFEVRVAAQGFANTVKSFNLEWTHAHPTWEVKLQRI